MPGAAQPPRDDDRRPADVRLSVLEEDPPGAVAAAPYFAQGYRGSIELPRKAAVRRVDVKAVDVHHSSNNPRFRLRKSIIEGRFSATA